MCRVATFTRETDDALVRTPVHVLPGFGYLAWQLVDAQGGDPAMTGFDAAIVKDGLITDLWTVLVPPQR